VAGTVEANTYDAMAWMNLQIVEGLRRLGHDAWYFETSSSWPYDPVREQKVCDSDYAVPYLERIVGLFGLKERWAYRRSYSDKEWLGLSRQKAEELLAHADVVFNVAGATRFAEEGLEVGRLVYFGTDPVYHEVTYASGLAETREIIAEHPEAVTYGENIGRPGCAIPPLPNLRAHTRQPVLLDLWRGERERRPHFTTVGNWEQNGREVVLGGETYLWSKHHEFLKFLDLPRRVGTPIELAMNLAEPETIHYGEGEPVKAWGVDRSVRAMLESHGFELRDARSFTTRPWPYREYIAESSGEFTVARDLNVRLRSGWFSERSACYLAAGRPVVTQDTGFGTVLPTGEGLFAFETLDEAVAAFEAIESNYDRHSRAARAIAEEYFRAETVLARLLEALGL
jgi:hypothetical protein